MEISCARDLLWLETASGPAAVHVEIADTAPKRAKGLMGRGPLSDGQGMLFVYDSPQNVTFWMKNTPEPLDMIFIDAKGIVRHIHENARPFDETHIPGAAPDDPQPKRLLVLETAGGTAKRLGLSLGAKVATPFLPQNQAKWRCAK